MVRVLRRVARIVRDAVRDAEEERIDVVPAKGLAGAVRRDAHGLTHSVDPELNRSKHNALIAEEIIAVPVQKWPASWGGVMPTCAI